MLIYRPRMELKVVDKVIEVKDLGKGYNGKPAIDHLDLDVNRGEILGLLGPNGSGKTTTINCILALLHYQSGSIKVFSKKIEPDSYDLKAKIGVVFQDIAVFDELTVYENIDYFCGLYISDKPTRKRYIEDALKLVSIEEFKKYYPKQLSGGLLRRLNIACGIAHKPKLIFLDEPTVAVDPQSRNNILDGIKRLRDDGATIVYTTHYMEEVEMICDRIVIIDHGKMIANGTVDELKNLANIKEKITVESSKVSTKVLELIRVLKNVEEVNYQNNILTISYSGHSDNLVELINLLKSSHVTYGSIYSNRPTLNDVFLDLTGKGLRD